MGIKNILLLVILFFNVSFISFAADKKISDLDAAGAIGGTEVFPIVQSGTTKQVSINKVINNLSIVTNDYNTTMIFNSGLSLNDTLTVNGKSKFVGVVSVNNIISILPVDSASGTNGKSVVIKSQAGTSSAGESRNAGDLIFTAANGVGSNGNGGDVNITGGDASGGGAPGDVYLKGGTGIPTGGDIKLHPKSGRYVSIISGNIKLNTSWLSGDGGSEGVFVSSNGNVGIGDNTPAVKLEIAGTVSGSAAQINGLLTMGGNIKLGSNYLSGDGDNEGLLINSTGQLGIGKSASYLVDITGNATQLVNVRNNYTNLSTPGVTYYGTVLEMPGRTFITSSKIGNYSNLYGISNASTAIAYYGNVSQNIINSGEAIGIYGKSTGVGSAGNNYGVYGIAQNNSAFNIGVRASATGTTGTNYGLYAEGDDKAGYFAGGDVEIDNNLNVDKVAKVTTLNISVQSMTTNAILILSDRLYIDKITKTFTATSSNLFSIEVGLGSSGTEVTLVWGEWINGIYNYGGINKFSITTQASGNAVVNEYYSDGTAQITSNVSVNTITFKILGNASNQAKVYMTVKIISAGQDGSGNSDGVVYRKL